ncbi:MAG: RluA family pseudouridine synthase [Butyribacter sp.]|nr:RluA family pseudouridine synthase [bacterium]MDY3853518.1 RluA family pseudouridine synthase [Butyribacter sp.]
MENEKELKFIVETEETGVRLDQFLVQKLPEITRSFLQKRIKEGKVLVNGKNAKAGNKLSQNDCVVITLEPPKELAIEPENIPLDILFEDEDIIVINKPKQMVVHPAPGHYTGTVVNALLYHCKDSLSGINGVMRPGIVHRIDQDTTGAIVICKNDYAHNFIAEQLKEHSITRTYHAIVHNNITTEEGTIESTLGRHPVDRKKMAMNVKNGKHAVTHYKVLDHLNGKYNYICCNLETGRTHQIRVHMSSIGHPILGDAVYGPKKCPFQLTGQTLHAKTLGFIHPRTKEYMEFDAPLPAYFTKLLEQLQH